MIDEPSITDLLSDIPGQLVMKRDGLIADDVFEVMERAKSALLTRPCSPQHVGQVQQP